MDELNFWKDKNVLLTGLSGFKGSWLTIILSSLGAKVYGISLPPVGINNLFDSANIKSLCESHFCNINNLNSLTKIINYIEPEVVFHLAAQPLVRESYNNPIETFSTNIIGTANILEVLRNKKSVKSIILATTDKVYKNKSTLIPYKENDELGGDDPYSASKSCAEILINSYKKSFYKDGNVSISSVRAGNVIGGGDWSKDRLIPDAVEAWKQDRLLSIRNPTSVRPWQHVIEPLFGYVELAQKSYNDINLSGEYNFGPNLEDTKSVEEVVTIANAYFGKGNFKFNKSTQDPHEEELLTLDIQRAKHILGFYPKWNIDMAIKNTIHWYKDFYLNSDPYKLCIEQIDSYLDN